MTIKMQILATGLGLTLALTGCKKKDEGGEAETQGTKVTETQPTETETPPEPVKKTAADHVKFVQEGWAEWNAGDFDALMQRYADDAVCEMVGSGMPVAEGKDACRKDMEMFKAGFPDMKGTLAMTFADDERVVVVSHVTGTHSASFMGMEPTNKKVGVMGAHVFEMNEEGLVAKQSNYSDMVTLMGQLGVMKGPHRAVIESAETMEPVIATGSETEKALGEMLTQFNAAMSKGEPAWDMMADDFVAVDYSMPEDIEGVEAMKKMYAMWNKAMSDMKFEVEWSMVAGDYIIQAEKYSGKNTGPLPAMGLKKATNKDVSARGIGIHHVADGKVDKSWSFMNSMEMGMQLGLIEPPKAPAGDGAADKGAADKGAADKGAE